MKIPEIDSRTKENIIEQIKKRSETYTPEWRFDIENPDAGTGLAFIYADMYQDTIQKYNQLPKKNRLEFFNQSGTFLQPAKPANGYIQLSLVHREVEGIAVHKGTKLLAESQTGSRTNIMFETLNDIYITPAEINHIFQILPDEDGIYHMNQKQDQKDVCYPFPMFRSTKGNLQEHIMYLSHHTIFDTGSNSRIYVYLQQYDLLCKMLDQNSMTFEYSTGTGYESFAGIEVEKEGLVLIKGENQPHGGVEVVEGIEAYWIRMQIKDINQAEHFRVSQIAISGEEQGIYPELVFVGGIEEENRGYTPFGEQMGIYEEFYISCNEGFSKKGAQISIDFQIHFIKIPIETYGQVRNIDWKLIMKQSDFMPDLEYDIGIQEVIWEYFNGRDWRKLPESHQYSKLFTLAGTALSRNISMIFNCPDDWEKILVYSAYSRFLRCRVIKMNNQFRIKGQYVPPVVSDTKIAYKYLPPFHPPEDIILKNNLNIQRIKGKELMTSRSNFMPFEKIADQADTLYLGFDMPLSTGPIKLLIQMKGIYDFDPKQPTFEFYNGKKWKVLNVIDGTEGFIREGIISILGNSDFSAIEMWGKELYWIRISARERSGQSSADNQWPIISDIQMNVTEIVAVDTKEIEYFNIKINEKNAQIQLSDGNIYKADVWIRERHMLSELVIEQLKENYKIELKEAENSIGNQVWICWKEVENFAASKPMDCHYMIDKDAGLVRFSDGVRGRIPDSGDYKTIMVRYKCGGGTEGNLPVGAVNRLHSTIGYINYVSNPDRTTGGMDQEKAEDAMQRTARSFRNRGRAVTLKDYEELARESSRDILIVKSYSNCNNIGEKAAGNIALVIVVENYFKNRRFFLKIKKHIISYLMGKVPEYLFRGNRIHIIEPDFIQLSVRVRVYVKDVNEVFQVRNEILDRLSCFMNLINGNFLNQGWEVGQLPNQMQISNAITSVLHVLWIEDLRISAHIEGKGKKEEIDFTEAGRMKFAVPIDGDHNIEIFIGGVEL